MGLIMYARRHNVGFSGGHGPHDLHPAQMPPAMDVRCKPCWMPAAWARAATATTYQSAMSGADWGSVANGADPARPIPDLLSIKKSVNDLTGAQPANVGFSGGHGPHDVNPA